MFDDVPSLLARLVMGLIPAFEPASALDFLMCFGSRPDAAQAAAMLLRSLPEAEQRYRPALARFRAGGLPSHSITVHGEVLAAATVAFGFPDLTTLNAQ